MSQTYLSTPNLSYNWAIRTLIFILIVRDVQSSSRYKEKCSSNNDCIETGYCDKETWTCVCQEINTPKLKMKPFFEDGKCVSPVGGDNVCTMIPHPMKATWECTKNAECRKDSRLPSTLGMCSCRNSYEPSNDGVCIPTEQSYEKPTSSLSQGENGGTNIQKWESKWLKSGGSRSSNRVDFEWAILISGILYVFFH